MATQVQFRRGNTTQTSTFTGAVAEITVDTDKDTVVVHDGITAGGFALARESALTSNNQLSQSAFNHANSAFATANNEAGVNTTQNNSITAAFTAANSAGVYANSAFAAANAATATDATQNNSITAAFTAANSSGVYANGAFTRANNSLNANTGGTISGDLVVTGNLIIQGNTITSNASVFVANDTLIILGAGNYTTDILDIGFAGHYNAGTNAHTGFIRDSVTKEWFLFKNYTPEVGANNNINTNDASFTIDTINANLKSTVITLNNQDLSAYVNNAFNTANAAFNSANVIDGVNLTQNNSITAAFVAANSSGVYANGAFATANNEAGVNLTQNNSITASFIAANSAGVYANGAFATANNEAGVNLTQNISITAAFTAANSAGVYANAAFDKANAAGGGGVSSTGWTNNAIIYANSTGVLSNTSNLIYIASNNTVFLAGSQVATIGDSLALSIALG